MKCIVVGLDHCDQTSDTKSHDVERSLCEILDDNGEIELIAEERRPTITIETVPQKVAAKRGIRCAPVDMPLELREQLGIAEALQDRFGFDPRRKVRFGCYLNHEDGLREKYWIDQIMKDGAKNVAVICGTLHVDQFAAKMRQRGWEVRQFDLCAEAWYREAHPTVKFFTRDGRRCYEEPDSTDWDF